MFALQILVGLSTYLSDFNRKFRSTSASIGCNLGKILRKYNEFTLTYPLLSMVLTTGTTMGLGNIISQCLIESRSLLALDWPRIIRFSAFGYFLSGPFVRYWYYGLEKFFSNTRWKPIKMMISDQTIAAPLLNGAMIIYLALVSGKTFEETKVEFFTDFPVVMKANYFVWPFIQLSNFYFIPVQHRVLYANLCAVIWSTFVAFVTK